MKSEVVCRIEGEEGSSFRSSISQLLFIAEPPMAHFVSADHIEVAQSQRRGHALMDILV